MRRIGEIRPTGKVVIRRDANRFIFAQAIERYIIDVTSKRPREASRKAEEAGYDASCGHLLAVR